jgi:K+-sensing histidine kinase KdpD
VTPTSGPTTVPSSPATLQARFLAVISHELRTPLTAIASFTESLDAGDLAERTVAVAAVRRNTERMLALVEDLMVVSRLQAGDLELHTGSVDPARLIREAVELLAVREPQTAAVIEAADGLPVSADEPLLRDLFYAVIGTVACGATDRSASITATTGAQAWHVTIAARRAAPLTDERLMAGMLAIPEPPYRRRSTALWMLLAEAIAARHGGSVELTFDPLAGAGAEIMLPATIPTD